jgi:hypothetical protein
MDKKFKKKLKSGVKEHILNNLNKELTTVQSNIIRNKRTINILAAEQRKLKEVRHELTNLIYDINNCEIK